MAEPTYRFDIGDVLSAVNLEELFDDLRIASKGSGRNRRFSCPDPSHQDADPSTTVGPKTRGFGESFKCWSGGHSGDAIDVLKLQGRVPSDVEALEWLAAYAVVGENEPGHRPRRPPTRAAVPQFVPFSSHGRNYVQRCHAMLGGDLGTRQRQWLAERGISMETARTNLVGADPGFTTVRRDKGLPAGTIPGVTFPALGPDGGVTYVQARSLPEDVVEASELSAWHAERGWRKYDNPAGHVGSNPRVSFQICPDGVSRATEALVITEGIPDGLIAAQEGFRAVSILGNQAPDGRAVALVANVATSESLDVVLAVDADAGGSHARQLLRDELTAAGIDPIDVALPDGLDLNDWALSDSQWADQLETRIHSAQSGLQHNHAPLAADTAHIGLDGGVESAWATRAIVADHLYGLAGPMADGLHAEQWHNADDVTAALASWDPDRLGPALVELGALGATIEAVDARIRDDALPGSWLADNVDGAIAAVQVSFSQSPPTPTVDLTQTALP